MSVLMGRSTFCEEDEIKLEKTFKHTIEIVVDRIKVKDGVQEPSFGGV